MPSIDALVTGGGYLGLAALAIHLGRLLLDYLRHRHQQQRTPSRVMGDTAAANAVLVQTVEILQTENGRLVKRVKHLEEEDRRKDAKITDLEKRLAIIADELSELRSDHR